MSGNPLYTTGGSDKRLLALWKKLGEEDRRTLFDLAEFLVARSGHSAVPGPVPAPAPLPRPAQESVVKAIKRLSASYFMIDTAALLNETSALMAQHVMQGRSATDVIDELERLFAQRYRQLVEEK